MVLEGPHSRLILIPWCAIRKYCVYLFIYRVYLVYKTSLELITDINYTLDEAWQEFHCV